MKKWIACFLCLVMTLGLLAGCGSSEGEAEATTPAKIEAFSVGYGKANISPTESVPLRGYGDAMERFSTGNLEPMYATCVAFADTEGEIVLLISTDITNSADTLTHDSRELIEAATGVPKSHILFTASHSHSAPDYSKNVPSISNWMNLFKERAVEAAKAALADLAPATAMETGFNRVDNTNTVRHYLLTDGSYQGRAVGAVSKDKLVGHYSKVDNLLQVVRFTREGDKRPIILVNWCGHPMGVGDALYTLAGPNYPGILRQTLEEQYGCDVSFVLSGSGNVNNGSQISSDIKQEDYVDLGRNLAAEVSNILENLATPSKLDKIQFSENLWVTPGKDGMNKTVPLYAFSIGDWACVTAPFEIFDTNAMAVRDASKFKMTFYASCANESHGYLPTPPSFSFDITYEAEITKYPMGTAELVQEQLIGQLDEIFAASGNEIVDKGEGYNTPEFVPSSDGTIYRNPAPGDTNNITPVKNGFYAVNLMAGTKFKTMLCIDEATAQAVVAETEMELLLNEQSVVVGVVK